MKYIKRLAINESTNEFGAEEMLKIMSDINEILTVFKDDGIKYIIFPDTEYIEIRFKVSAYFYSDNTNIEVFGKVWGAESKQKMNRNLEMLQMLMDESDNLFMKLELILNVNKIYLDDEGFHIILTKLL